MSVEFLSEDDAATPPAPPPRRARPWWWLVVAALVVAAVGWAVTRPSSTPDAAPTSTPAPIVATHVDPGCLGVPACGVETSVPAPIRVLAGRYLPAGTSVRVHSVVSISSLTQEELLVQRDMRATVDSVTVLVSLRRTGSGSTPIVTDPPGFGSVLIHTINSGFVVRLQYLAPETVPPNLARLRAFIADVALVSTGD